MSVSIESTLGVRITGTGMALPSDVGVPPNVAGRIDNHQLYRTLFGVRWQDELARRSWTVDGPELRWGIRSREWLHLVGTTPRDDAPDVVDLAIGAARAALRDANVDGSSVDVLLAATSTPARVTSTLAARVGQAIGCSAACFDVRAGGAGGISAWVTATRTLGAGARRALVVAAEAPSLYLDERELRIASVYGDGAGALVLDLDSSAKSGLVSARFERRDPVGVPFTVPGRLPPSAHAIESHAYRFQRPDAAYSALLDATWRDTMRALEGASIDVFLPYAVTSKQVDEARQTLGLGAERTVHRLADLGCLGSAGPLVHLHTARKRAEWKSGTTLASAAVAGGVTSVALVWRV